MTQIFAKHKVNNYKNWRKNFENGPAKKIIKEYGAKSYHLYHFENDPNTVAFLLTWDNTENAKRFFESDELKKTAKENGVVGPIETCFLVEDSEESL